MSFNALNIDFTCVAASTVRATLRANKQPPSSKS